MKPIFLFLFVAVQFFATSTKAQTVGQVYSTYINEAELLVVAGKYNDALIKYEKAFESTKVEFTIDIYNASVCAAKLKSNAKVLAFSDKLVSKGVGEKFFSRNIFNAYHSNKNFVKIIAKAEKQKNEYAVKTKKFRADIKEFIKKDSVYTRLSHTKYSDYDKMPDTLQRLYTKNAHNYLTYIQVNGYPTENKLGANILQDTIIGFFTRPDLITLHYLEIGEDKELLSSLRDLLLDNLNRAEIKSYNIIDMMALTEWRNTFKSIGDWVFKKYDCKIFLKNEIEELVEFNAARKLYCMESIEDYGKKIVFKYGRESHFIFQYNIIGGDHINDKTFFYSAFHEITPVKNCPL